MKHTVEHIQLKNGAQGLLIDVPGTTVTRISINFRAGDYLAPKGKTDTAHIMEHLAFGANNRYESTGEFSKDFSKNGAYNNASTGDYHMDYIAECAEFETERILDLLCVALESPKYVELEFKAEVANVREELKSHKNSHSDELALELENKLGLVPKTYATRATELDSITREDIKNHHDATHYASNMRFVIAGPIAGKRRAEIVDRIENIALEKGTGRIGLPVEKFVGINEKPLVKYNATLENIYYRLETLSPSAFSKQQRIGYGAYCDLLFGTFHSRIFGKARERGLLYGIHSSSYDTKQNTIGLIAGQVLPQNIDRLFDLITTEINDVRAGNISSEELNGVKEFQLGNYQRSAQTVGQLVGIYDLHFAMYDEVYDYFGVPASIEQLTNDQLIDAANHIFASKQWGLGFDGATDKIKPDLLAAKISRLY